LNYVVDTSALMRLFIPDGDLPDGLSSALAGAENGSDALLAPELVLAEAGQVLHKKRMAGILTDEELSEIAAGIQSLPIRLSTHKGRLTSACQLAQDLDLTVYDALFLDLARTHSASLITADQSLARAARAMLAPGGGQPP